MSNEHNARLQKLQLLQATFSSFVPFLIVSMKFLGFSTTAIQKDIAQFLEYGPKDLMVQAQRGQAKSTITAIFAVWCLIHNPRARILIVSAGGTQANEISTLICRMILNMPILECLRPDSTAGDRTSVEHFDIHYSLKGIDKSPSVACMGITGNMQGKRADILIADDVESAKNSRTAMMRELLLSLIKDFPSICQNGRIIYLGTPQSEGSIYNTLPAAGFAVRIWPGRYPTPEQIAAYGDNLAPYIRSRMQADAALIIGGGMLGDMGQPTDPELLGEHSLTLKEQKQGQAYFMLQHMLSTKMSDEMRHPLKAENLVVMRLGDQLPIHIVRGMTHEYIREYAVGGQKVRLSVPSYVSTDLLPRAGRVMYIDPAGGGGDDTAYAVVDQLNGTLFVRAACSVRGGFSDASLNAIAAVAAKWQPDLILVESNMGHGSVRMTLLPILRQHKVMCKVEDEHVTGQKEVRIIDTLEPPMGRGAIVIDESVVLEDWATTSHHPMEKRQLFTLFHQLTKLTKDRGSLNKDDRIDCLASACRYWLKAIGQDSSAIEQKGVQRALDEWRKDPLGKSRYTPPAPRGSGQSVIRRR